MVALYQQDVTGRPLDDLVERDAPLFTRELVEGVDVEREEIDALIERHSEGWTLDRIAPLERNILRVAIHEMLDWPDIPAAVSINEAVDLAKSYGGIDGHRFVNGVLDKLAAQWRAAEYGARR